MIKDIEVGSNEYFSKLLEDCHKGIQRCDECHVLDCCDNMNPFRQAGLIQTILDFIQERYTYQKQIKTLENQVRELQKKLEEKKDINNLAE